VQDRLEGNWLLANKKDHELRRLLAEGDAVQTHRFIVPVLHAHSVQEYLAFIETYVGMKNELLQGHYYLRGQNRDYFSPDGHILQVLPPAYRTRKWWLLYNNNDERRLEKLDRLLAPWKRSLEDTGQYRFGRSGVSYFEKCAFSDDSNMVHRFVISKRPSDLVTSNIVAMAVLQHYGFPTPCLDVTRSPWIALWFALHQTHHIHKGRVMFMSIEGAESSATHNVDCQWHLPSVYIFIEGLEPHSPPVDYGDFEWLKQISIRPSAQVAASLPYQRVGHMVREEMGGALLEYTNRFYSPVGLIKIHFPAKQLHKQNPKLNQALIFPDSDPLYQIFCRIRPPYFIEYVSESC
jgi:hypothetical protein